MKYNTFSNIPKANDRIWDKNSWHLHDPRNHECRNHK